MKENDASEMEPMHQLSTVKRQRKGGWRRSAQKNAQKASELRACVTKREYDDDFCF